MVLRFDEIDSTNAYCLSHAEALENRSFVTASYQSAGKGREDRIWNSERGVNLLFSFFLKGERALGNIGLLSCLAAVGVSKVLEGYGLKPSIKWPNDVYLNGKKVAGILLQGRLPEYCVIGIGINVNQQTFEGNYRIPPTSLCLELGKPLDKEALFEELQRELMDLLDAFDKNTLLDYARSHDYLWGESISFLREGVKEKGLAKGFDEDFRLLLETSHGLISLSSGEVLHE